MFLRECRVALFVARLVMTAGDGIGAVAGGTARRPRRSGDRRGPLCGNEEIRTPFLSVQPMPRYQLEPSPRLLPSHTAGAVPSPARKAVDLGQFWFNGYAVSIRLLGNGKLWAQRVVKQAPGGDVLQKILYWLRTVFDLEGGRAWYLNARDGAEVLSQRWAEYRNDSLDAFVPAGTQSAAPAPAPAQTQAQTQAGTTNLLSLRHADPALRCVIENLNRRDRTALSLVHKSMRLPKDCNMDLDARRAMRTANGIRTLKDLKAVAAEYGLCGPGSSSAGRLSAADKVGLLGALASRLAALPVHQRSGAARHLLELAARLPDDSRRQAQLALLMHSHRGQRAEIEATLVPDKAAYTALAAALTPTQRQQGLRALTVAFMASAGVAAEARARRWDELFADAEAAVAAESTVAAHRLAVLAGCLKEIESGELANRLLMLGARALERWHTLRQQLDRLPRPAGTVLASALARCLWYFDEAQQEGATALALLQQWQGNIAPGNPHEVELSLALLGRIAETERADSWSRVWDRIEADRLVDHGKEAVYQLAWVPAQEHWPRVIQFCRDGIAAYPRQCADMLLALIHVVDKRRGADPSPDTAELKSALHEVALDLLKCGGPAAPLLQCRWIPKDHLLAAMQTHVPWPDRALVLAQWLETGPLRDNAEPALSSLLPGLTPALNELVALTRNGASDETCDACTRALSALARRCDEALLAGAEGLNTAVQIAEALLPLVRGMRSDDTAPAAAALAQLVNSLALVAAQRRDSAHDRRIGTLLERIWALSRRLPSTGRQAMLQELIALKAPAPPPNDTRRNPHFWTEQTLRRAVQAVADDLPAGAAILADLASAEFMVNGIANYDGHFGDLRKRIWTKAMAMPDEQFVEVAGQIAVWFAKAPPGDGERRAWREARSAFFGRVKALPAEPYRSARERIEYWTAPL
ncbi:hypothetical protein EM868_20600 [Cupriavidus gilardii]|uniref:hypothetical protein n=1 Tax=Cupriavidus gilardii TaxID=82541 RepID=UPI001EE61E20|nr:hypothetical protein [Cupriavidus gilardii]MCG5259421.1 hypothetical protein [Cupriavidus gilardii]MDF9432165.1 hypothetical protein [Cupriavidus gilardii]